MSTSAQKKKKREQLIKKILIIFYIWEKVHGSAVHFNRRSEPHSGREEYWETNVISHISQGGLLSLVLLNFALFHNGGMGLVGFGRLVDPADEALLC